MDSFLLMFGAAPSRVPGVAFFSCCPDFFQYQMFWSFSTEKVGKSHSFLFFMKRTFRFPASQSRSASVLRFFLFFIT